MGGGHCPRCARRDDIIREIEDALRLGNWSSPLGGVARIESILARARRDPDTAAIFEGGR